MNLTHAIGRIKTASRAVFIPSRTTRPARKLRKRRPQPRLPRSGPPHRLKKRRPFTEKDRELSVQQLVQQHQADIADVKHRLRQAELETYREKFDKERVIGELLDTQAELSNERTDREALEDVLRVVNRITVDLASDTGNAMSSRSAEQSLSAEDISSIPDRLLSLRLHSPARSNGPDDGAWLEHEMDELRAIFEKREIEWLDAKEQSRVYSYWLQSLQLEFGMALWRFRGKELELIATHRDLDSLYSRLEALQDIETRLSEAQAVNEKIYEHLEKQLKHIQNLEDENAQLRGHSRESSTAFEHQKSKTNGYAQKVATVTEQREEAYEKIRQLEAKIGLLETAMRRQKGDSYASEITTVAATDEDALLTASPRKTVHFREPRFPTAAAEEIDVFTMHRGSSMFSDSTAVSPEPADH